MSIADFLKNITKIFESVNKYNSRINKYKAISEEPSLPVYAFINWGRYLISLGQHDEGLEKLHQSALIGSSHPLVYLNLGIIYAQNNQLEESLKNLKKALKYDRGNPKIWTCMASVYALLNDIKFATSAFEKSIRLDKKNPNAFVNYGIFAYQNLHQNAKAKKLLKKALALDIANIKALLMWGIILYDEAHYIYALTKFKKIFAIDPFNPDGLYYCAKTLYELSKIQESIEYCKKGISAAPLKLGNYILLSRCYAKLEDEQNAIYNLTENEHFFAQRWEYYEALADVLAHFGHHQEAVEKYNRAIDMGAHSYECEIYEKMISSQVALERYDEAIETAHKILESEPDLASIYHTLGHIYFKQKRYELALDNYKKTITLDARLKDAYNGIAESYLSMDDVQNAIKYWKKAVEYDCKNTSALLNLALVYLNRMNDCKQAVNYARSAYEFNREDADVVYKYGVILLKSDEIYRALDKFSDVIKLDKDMPRAYIAIAECNLKLDKPNIALEALAQYQDYSSCEKEYLVIKLMALFAQLKKDEKNEELISLTASVCDKIQNEYGHVPMLDEITEFLGKTKEV